MENHDLSGARHTFQLENCKNESSIVRTASADRRATESRDLIIRERRNREILQATVGVLVVRQRVAQSGRPDNRPIEDCVAGNVVPVALHCEPSYIPAHVEEHLTIRSHLLQIQRLVSQIANNRGCSMENRKTIENVGIYVAIRYIPSNRSADLQESRDQQ